MATETHPEEHTPAVAAEDAAHHPGPRQYVMVAVVLALITGLEVGLYYVSSLPRGILILSLMVLMVLKFAIVALWFMHLRFDSRIYRRLFVTGIILAISVFMIVLLTFGVFTS